MICPEYNICLKVSKEGWGKCRHSKPHKLHVKCKATCSHTDSGHAVPCIDETAIGVWNQRWQLKGKFIKLKVREKEIRMWSQRDDS